MMLRRALVEFILPWLIGAVIATALSASGAHALSLPTSSAGPGQYAVDIASVTALTVPEFAALAQTGVEYGGVVNKDDPYRWGLTMARRIQSYGMRFVN